MEERRLPLSQPPASTNLRLDGKVALVTGGGSGIGQAIALKFAAHGASVRVLDVSLAAGEETCRQIVSAGGKASACACDVTDQKRVKETFTSLAEHGPLAILVNNAGVSHIGTIESTTEADFDRVFRVNVKGFYNCMQAAVATMKTQGEGVILNMASIAGSVGLADRFAYSMSKAAVISMTYSVARDCPCRTRFAATAISRPGCTLHLSIITCAILIRGAKVRCSRNYRRRSPLEEWRNRQRSPPWRSFCVRMRRPSSPELTTRSMAAS